MSIEEEFAALRESADEQSRATWKRFAEKNADPEQTMRSKGVLIEYAREFDRLRVTVGELREGMALFAGEVVVMADPETLEWVGLDVPDFKESLSVGGLNATWERLSLVLDRQPVQRVPPAALPRIGEEPDAAPDLLRDLALEFNRELAAV